MELSEGGTLAAKQLNRRAVGADISKEYCELAANNCAQEMVWGEAENVRMSDGGREM